VAYSVEGGHSKLCVTMKRLCNEDPVLAHAFLSKYTDSLCLYASHQIESGAQVLQVFESWAHHLTEEQFVLFAKVTLERRLSSIAYFNCLYVSLTPTKSLNILSSDIPRCP
jgi:uroporphyrinogen decarboxylase